jgi:hypothetical protein
VLRHGRIHGILTTNAGAIAHQQIYGVLFYKEFTGLLRIINTASLQAS